MKCKAKFQAPRIDLTAYKAKLQKHMTEEISYALSEWLRVVIDKTAVGKMPVWSGASRATFLKLAREIEYNGITIAPVVPSREQQGENASTGELNANKKGDNRYTFTYSTNLPWLVTNENFNANLWGLHLHDPGPYQFQLAGIEAFEELAKDVHLLPVTTTVKSIRVG